MGHLDLQLGRAVAASKGSRIGRDSSACPSFNISLTDWDLQLPRCFPSMSHLPGPQPHSRASLWVSSPALVLIVMHQSIVVTLRDVLALSKCLPHSFLVTSHPHHLGSFPCAQHPPDPPGLTVCVTGDAELRDARALPRPPGMCKGKCVHVKEGTEMH